MKIIITNSQLERIVESNPSFIHFNVKNDYNDGNGETVEFKLKFPILDMNYIKSKIPQLYKNYEVKYTSDGIPIPTKLKDEKGFSIVARTPGAKRIVGSSDKNFVLQGYMIPDGTVYVLDTCDDRMCLCEIPGNMVGDYNIKDYTRTSAKTYNNLLKKSGKINKIEILYLDKVNNRFFK